MAGYHAAKFASQPPPTPSARCTQRKPSKTQGSPGRLYHPNQPLRTVITVIARRCSPGGCILTKPNHYPPPDHDCHRPKVLCPVVIPLFTNMSSSSFTKTRAALWPARSRSCAVFSSLCSETKPRLAPGCLYDGYEYVDLWILRSQR